MGSVSSLGRGLMTRSSKVSEMSPEDKRKSMYGDKKQGDKLVKKKFATPSYHTKGGSNGKVGGR